MAETKYYQVMVGLPATWNSNQFTYASTEQLAVGTIVIVPFGKKQLIGFIESPVEKPNDTYDIKHIDSVLELSLSAETVAFAKQTSRYYPNSGGSLTQQLLPSYVKNLPTSLETTKTSAATPPPKLTQSQSEAVAKILSTDKPSVLYGVTGSGKTRVYAELAQKALNENKNVLVLYPEISLTTQLVTEMKRFIGDDKVTAYTSGLTRKQQKIAWQTAHDSEGGHIFMGTRSALFLPLRNLELLIVDEAHDSSFKQDNGMRYNGIFTAGLLAKCHNAKLILGSATPPVQETAMILSSGGNLVSMTQLAVSDSEKLFHVIDMKAPENRSSSSTFLSPQLVKQLASTLKKGQQSLLFLNKRGTAKLIQCESCGWHAECQRCDMPLTYHHDEFRLQCNVCGQKHRMSNNCPSCGSTLEMRSLGIKALEQDVKKLFPHAKIARFDSDNKKSESLAENFAALRDGSYDIIIGTQLVTKGLDLPRLETVGVLNADASLLLPDYVSRERTFQQINQVSGRVGRGHTDGVVYLQSYLSDPVLNNYIVQNDWPSFFGDEQEIRKKHGFPPASFALKLTVNKRSSETALKLLLRVSEGLPETVRVLGPAPSFYGKQRGNYSWNIVLLSPTRSVLVKVARELPKDVIYDLDPVSLL